MSRTSGPDPSCPVSKQSVPRFLRAEPPSKAPPALGDYGIEMKDKSSEKEQLCFSKFVLPALSSKTPVQGDLNKFRPPRALQLLLLSGPKLPASFPAALYPVAVFPQNS